MADPRDTLSLCPVCLTRIPAKRIDHGGRVSLVKKCPDHGDFKTLIWDGYPTFSSWSRPKIPFTPPLTCGSTEKGCPYDCGLCPDHRQRSCTILLEVTHRCNLSCSFCYADSGHDRSDDPNLETIRKKYASAAHMGGNCHIQLSGGEPTLRNDLPEIVSMGQQSGFSLIQLNTNGVRLAKDAGFVRDLKAAGLDSVFLQFDGVTPQTHEKIRGRNLLDEKLAAISVCGENRIGVVLVPTLVPGINTDEIGAMIKTAMALSPVVRGIHFQPVSYFGRFPKAPSDEDRFTLPRLMRVIESQTEGLLKTRHFKPPGCENALCSFHATYLLEDGTVRLLGGDRSCCGTEPEPGEAGAARTIARIGRQWSSPIDDKPGSPPKRGLQNTGHPICLDDFLLCALRNTFSVSAMAFQDVWNLDLERLKDCCIHVMRGTDQLVPFCAYNLTDVNGEGLYRGHHTP